MEETALLGTEIHLTPSLFQPEHGLRQVPPICLKYTQALHTSISAGEIRRGEVTFTQITLCEMD